MVRFSVRGGLERDLRGAWGFARDVPRRGSWAQETAIQALKAGIAAVLAWFLAAHVLHLPQPYLAPWVALCMVRPTVHWSVLTGLRQVAAVVLGVLIAVAAVALMPGKELALAVAVPVAFLASTWPRLDDQGLNVPFTALFMVALDTVEGPFVLYRLTETVLGAAVGMGVNLLLAPPFRVLTVAARARRNARDAAALLRDLAARLRETEAGAVDWSARARRLEDDVAATGEALQHARDGLRLNPRKGEARVQDSVSDDAEALDLVRRIARATRALADLVEDTRSDRMPDLSLDPGFRPACADVLDAAADATERRITALLSRGDDAGDDGTDLTAALDVLERRADPDCDDRPETETQGALLMAMRRLVLAITR
ncbi:aromatic acid exporter family protein [Glycomyces scopariae]